MESHRLFKQVSICNDISQLRNLLGRLAALLPSDHFNDQKFPKSDSSKIYYNLASAIVTKYLRGEFDVLFTKTEQNFYSRILTHQWYIFSTIRILVNCGEPFVKNVVRKTLLSPMFPKSIIWEYRNGREDYRIIATLPEKVPSLPWKKILRKVVRSCLEYTVDVRSNKEKKIMVKFLTKFSSILCRRGYPEVPTWELVKFVKKVENSELFLEMFLETFPPDKSFEKLIVTMFYSLQEVVDPVDNIQILVNVLVNILQKKDGEISKKVEQLISFDFLLKYNFFAHPKARIVIVETIVNSNLLLKSLTNCVCQWKERSFTKFTQKEKQNYVFEIVVLLLSCYSNEEFQKQNVLIKYIMEGVQIRLDSTVDYVRKSGIVIGEKFSSMLNQKIGFEEYVGEMEKIEKNYFDEKKKFFKSASLVSEKREEKINEREETKKEVSTEPKKKKKRTIDPNEFYFNDDNDSSSESESSDSEGEDEPSDVDDNVSDVDSLESFGLEDDDLEEDLLVVKKPRYLRELIPFLTAKPNDYHVVDKNEMALEHGAELVRQKPDDIDDMSVPLAKYVLFLNNTYEIKNFGIHKKEILVSLLVCSPNKVVPYLVKEFYGRDLSINTRIVLLKCFKKSAQELSNRDPISNKLEKIDNLKNPNPQKMIEEIKQKYPGKTRVWGVKSIKRKDPKTLPNNFIDIAELFFYPLLNEYDTDEATFRMLTIDHYVLSELIVTVGSIVFCCGNHYVGHKLALSLLDFLWIMKYQHSFHDVKEKRIVSSKFEETDSKGIVSVRRSVLFALLQTFLILPNTIFWEQQEKILEFLEWISNVEKNDSDDECRNLSRFCLVEIKHKLDYIQKIN